jgi:hypothetical protein
VVASAARKGRESRRRAKRPDSLERAADELYGLPLQDFVAARNARVKELRGAGRRDEAGAVQKLQKPTLPSWVVNQLARRRELDVRRLAKAGEALRTEATDAAGFAEARREEADVLRRLLRAARELLESEGRPASGAMLERVGANLRAAAVSEDRRDALLQGRLAEDLEPAGFEALAQSAAAAGSRRKTSSSAAGRTKTAQRLKAARRKAEQAATEAEVLERTVTRAEDELATAKRAARDAERRLESARSKSDRARRQAERAATALQELESD